ncbi:titin-like [Paramacrobiotus metropolitanus]|uniref:titin-like n=1 Tax=Paramacrobiotus metropolitanus TaxID=2943436 RepID=UPI0024460139|nr:titin-like [Paramacrobiotus metropolitanus]
MNDLVNFLVGGFLLSTVSAVFNPDTDIVFHPWTPTGMKYVKQNSSVVIVCSAMSYNQMLRAANVTVESNSTAKLRWEAPLNLLVDDRCSTHYCSPMTSAKIQHFGTEHVGNYTCLVTIGGKVEGHRSVFINYFPSLNLSGTPEVVTKDLGAEAVELVCSTPTVPHGALGGVTAYWQFPNGTNITTTRELVPKYAVNGLTLTIRNVSWSDAGAYKCIAYQVMPNASNDGSDHIDVASRMITLAVERAPEFFESLTKVHRGANDMVNLTCDAVTGGALDPVFTWSRNGTILRELDDYFLPPCTHRSCLIPFNEDHSLFDDIRCTATNALGEASKAFRIIDGARTATSMDAVDPPAGQTGLVPTVPGVNVETQPTVPGVNVETLPSAAAGLGMKGALVALIALFVVCV